MSAKDNMLEYQISADQEVNEMLDDLKDESKKKDGEDDKILLNTDQANHTQIVHMSSGAPNMN